MIWRGILLTVFFVGVNSRSAHQHVKMVDSSPALAMFCGKATQHRQTTTGRWISGDGDCLKSEQEKLDYCKKVYSTLTITSIAEETRSVHIPSWCRLGSAPPCRSHGHNVKLVKCVEDNGQEGAPTPSKGCTLEHVSHKDPCGPSQFWEEIASQYCHGKNKTLSSPEVAKPCAVADMWKGIDFMCCDAPAVSKPKASKGQHLKTTDKKPEMNPICSQPKRIGLCRALLPAWHYNKDAGECQFFHYGGCGGNDNNFDSEDECISICQPEKAVPKPNLDNSFCGLPYETGMCRALFFRYYYDPSDGTCKEFSYGGCGGNKNNFNLKEDCEAKCKGFKKSRAKLMPAESLIPFQPGPVMLDEDMNPEKVEVETTMAAQTTRKLKAEMCSLLPETGKCRAAIPTFYYDAKVNECRFFSYGGCGGNANRFSTLEECNKACADLGDDMEDNSIMSSFDEDVYDEDVREMESVLDKDVDSRFDINGNPRYRVNPQALTVNKDDEDEYFPYLIESFSEKHASFVPDSGVLVGIVIAVLIIAVGIAYIWVARSRNRPPQTIHAEQPEESTGKELSSEEKQLLALQQNGYENPTYKLLERH